MAAERMATAWARYKQLVYGLGPGEGLAEHQERECKAAFMAGAWAFYTEQVATLDDTGNPNDVTDADLCVMAELHEELTRFFATVRLERLS